MINEALRPTATRVGAGLALVALFVALGYATVSARADAGTGPQNPCNPCAKKPDNPCAKKPDNPCAKKPDNPCNPCAKKPDNPCNPCGHGAAMGGNYDAIKGYASWKRLNERLMLSPTHGGMFVRTYANPAAMGAIAAGRYPFPAGAILVKEGYSAADGRELKMVFVMEKVAGSDPAHGDWVWATTSPAGAILEKGDSKAMQMCASCHAGAKGTDFSMMAAMMKK